MAPERKNRHEALNTSVSATERHAMHNNNRADGRVEVANSSGYKGAWACRGLKLPPYRGLKYFRLKFQCNTSKASDYNSRQSNREITKLAESIT